MEWIRLYHILCLSRKACIIVKDVDKGNVIVITEYSQWK